MEKFKVGQKVYCIGGGLSTIDEFLPNEKSPIRITVTHDSGNWNTYTIDGRRSKTDINPLLLTLEEARAKGYDVPKQKIVKEKTLYINLYKEPYSSYLHTNKDSAELSASKNTEDILVTAYPVTIKYEVEE